WVACDTVPQGFGPKALDGLTEGEEIQGLDMGVNLSKSPDVNFWVWTSGEETATSVLKTLQVGVNGKESFVLSPLLTQLKSGLEGGTLVLAAPLTAGTAAAKVGPVLAAFALPVDTKVQAPVPAIAIRAKVEAGPAVVAAPVVLSALPPPPKKLFIRIE